MSYDAVFRDVVGDLMREHGFFRIEKTYFRWLDEEQVVIAFSYEMLAGSREFRILVDLCGYIDGIGYIPSRKKKELGLNGLDLGEYEGILFRETGMNQICPYGYMTRDGSTKYSEDEFREQLVEIVEFYKKHILPDIFRIHSLEDLFEFKEYVRKYTYNAIKQIYDERRRTDGEEYVPIERISPHLLFEAIQLKKYDYALKSIKVDLGMDLVPEYYDLYKQLEKWLEEGNTEELDRFVDERVREFGGIYREYFGMHRMIY